MCNFKIQSTDAIYKKSGNYSDLVLAAHPGEFDMIHLY